MSDKNTQTAYDKATVYNVVLDCLQTVRPGIVDGLNPARPDSFLSADLSLQSIEFVRLASSIQASFEDAYLPFQDLFVTPDGDLVDDVTVQGVADFLFMQLNSTAE